MTKLRFQTLTGMHDILPEDQPYFRGIERKIEEILSYYNFERIDTPILESAELFAKGTGSTSDIVEKEMYVFQTKGGDCVALRPEFTPSIVRSYIQHGMINLPQPVKLWTIGSCFRHEKPQAGRYREFHQFDFEVLGEKSPIIDAQIIQISYTILKEIGFKDLTVHINSIGDSECAPYFRRMLVNYFKSRRVGLCADCQRRLKLNPLRILDCKEERCQQIKAGAPQILDHLCTNCHNHLKEVLEFLDEMELPYNLNPYLVRGLDYYTRTVFEIETKDTQNAQGSLIGGGRYDNLVKLLGGKDVPACGAAGGIERIVNLMKENQIKMAFCKPLPKVFVAQLGSLAKKKSVILFEKLRKANIPAIEAFSKDSLKNQLKIADRLGIKWVLIVGQKEAMESFVTLRDMQSGVQSQIKNEKIILELKNKLKKTQKNGN